MERASRVLQAKKGVQHTRKHTKQCRRVEHRGDREKVENRERERRREMGREREREI